jgi:hypothetical protein
MLDDAGGYFPVINFAVVVGKQAGKGWDWVSSLNALVWKMGSRF